MTPNTPFFISPAYYDPRITISFSVKLTEIHVYEVTSSVRGSEANSPPLITVKSGPLVNFSTNLDLESLMSICFMNMA